MMKKYGHAFCKFAGMKKLYLIATVILSLAISCSDAKQNNEKKDSSDVDMEADIKDKKVSSRDVSITSAVSYSDLFLDSTVVSNFIASTDLEKKLQRRILSFYNTRNYQYAWFAKDGLTEQARGFYNLYLFDSKHNSDSLTKDKKLQLRMDNLFAAENMRVSSTDKSILDTELKLTRLFIEHGLTIYEDGYVKRKEMERFIPARKVNALEEADSLLNKKHKDNKYFEDINESYKLLKQELEKYVAIAKKGGWPMITTTEKTIKPGTESPLITTIKQRLQITGDLAVADTSQKFDSALEEAVKSFQSRYGYTPNGIITKQLIADMNVPVEAKVKQILINLGRMRWMPSLPNGDMILVNIPEFVLHVRNGKQKVFDMNVVVGKEGHTTMMFTDDLNQVVFSPYWNVPPSIVKNEILPKMQSNPGYLASQNMEVVKQEGGLPVIRQLPGEKNSLGKVKFLFPNSFNIYFHDTPSKSLFNRDKRAYSHGCIRLSDPAKMANYLLESQPEWTPSAIDAAMNSGTEKFVKLKKPVPVFITYYTAWVDETGKLNFRDDIYSHDKSLATKMFSKS
jgi:murein L,D-transpeptidase YcbB/YkuD